MRVYLDLGGHDPTGVSNSRTIKYDETPERGGQTTINGQYVLEIPEGAAVVVDGNSFVFPQGATSLTGQAAQQLLVRYPMYDHILYNFFLDNADMDTIALVSPLPRPTATNTTPPLTGLTSPLFCRCKMGRTTGAGPVGMAPNRVEVLQRSFGRPAGSNVSGLVVSKTMDITSYNPVTPGTDEVMVWWRIASLVPSDDKNTNYGSGENTPTLLSLVEIGQEPLGFSVWVSNDDGATWYNTPYLEPVDLVNVGTDLRIAFVNQGDDPVNLLGYCILFPDLP